jgi:hypothetical protein
LALVYLVVFGGFACLFPLAFYCLVMSSVNARRRPTAVSGTTDFAGVLLATAGFWIVGGPLILFGLHEAWRRQALRGSFATIRAALDESSGPWLAAWVGYFVLVVVGAGWLLFRRRAVTVVYNIDPTDAQKLVPGLLDQLGLPWARRNGGHIIGGERQSVVMDVTVVPAMRHATFRWSPCTGDVRRRVEAELQRAVTTMEAPESPVAGWLLTASTGLFALLLILLGLFVALLWSLRA